MIDLAAVLADTPGAQEHVFLDSAGSSLPPTPVLQETIHHLQREAEVGGYTAAAERVDDLAGGQADLAELLGCHPDEIAFTDSATRAWLSLLDSVPLRAGHRILISEVEYGANAVALLRLAEQHQVTVETVPSDPTGTLSLDALRDMLDERVALLSLVHVPTSTGLVTPVREATAAAHAVGALVLLDACQSIGHLPVRMDDLGVDMLAGTGRKWLRGPRGTGFLAIRREVAQRLRPRLIDHWGASWDEPDRYRLRPGARPYELWERSVADQLGLHAAVRYALALGIDPIAAAVADRAGRLRTGLATIPGVEVRDIGHTHGGIVTFTVDGMPAKQVEQQLTTAGITVKVSGAHSARLDLGRRGLPEVLRASPHYFVTPQQIDQALTAVADLASP